MVCVRAARHGRKPLATCDDLKHGQWVNVNQVKCEQHVARSHGATSSLLSCSEAAQELLFDHDVCFCCKNKGTFTSTLAAS